MLDKILVFISMIALIAFCGVVVGYVREPDLFVVVVLVLALASHDFWISVFSKEQPTTLESGAELKDRYTAVSGKPLDSAAELEQPVASVARAKAASRSKKKKATTASRSRSRK